MKNRKGFTLIEFIVVILIIAVLGVIIMVGVVASVTYPQQPYVNVAGYNRSIYKFTFEGHEYLTTNPISFTHSGNCQGVHK